jgi:hypothetical protein
LSQIGAAAPCAAKAGGSGNPFGSVFLYILRDDAIS